MRASGAFATPSGNGGWFYHYQDFFSGLIGAAGTIAAGLLAWRVAQRQIKNAAIDAETARRATLAAIQTALNEIEHHCATRPPTDVPAFDPLLTPLSDQELNLIAVFRRAKMAVVTTALAYNKAPSPSSRSAFTKTCSALYVEVLRLLVLFAVGRSLVELLVATDAQLNAMVRPHINPVDAIRFLATNAPEHLFQAFARMQSANKPPAGRK
jgi:hypothetical protein